MTAATTAQAQDFGVIAQSFAVEVLSAVGNVPKHHRRHRHDDARETWVEDVVIPGAKNIIPILMDFAKTQTLTVKVNDFAVASWKFNGQPRATPSGLLIPVKQDVMGQTQFSQFEVPFLNDTIKQLLSGAWTPLKWGVEVKFEPTSLLPIFTQTPTGAKLTWKNPPKLRWNKWFFWRFEAQIDNLEITLTEGTLNLSPFGSVFVPTLVWGT